MHGSESESIDGLKPVCPFECRFFRDRICREFWCFPVIVVEGGERSQPGSCLFLVRPKETETLLIIDIHIDVQELALSR